MTNCPNDWLLSVSIRDTSGPRHSSKVMLIGPEVEHEYNRDDSSDFPTTSIASCHVIGCTHEIAFSVTVTQ